MAPVLLILLILERIIGMAINKGITRKYNGVIISRAAMMPIEIPRDEVGFLVFTPTKNKIIDKQIMIDNGNESWYA